MNKISVMLRRIIQESKNLVIDDIRAVIPNFSLRRNYKETISNNCM